MGWNVPVHWFNPPEMVFKTACIYHLVLQFNFRDLTPGDKQGIEKVFMAKPRLI